MENESRLLHKSQQQKPIERTEPEETPSLLHKMKCIEMDSAQAYS